MILAAGLGTRLRPLTDRIPKVLIEVGGVSILERIARRLAAAGAERIIVNVHHHPAQIEASVARLAGELGVEMLLSVEKETPLETGGGLAHAEPLFRKDGPFLLHNGDIVTDIDLAGLLAAHRATGALAMLAVGRRETTRFLLFDDQGLYGWENAGRRTEKTCRPVSGNGRRLPFAGVHAISPEIFGLITEKGAFSILDLYLRLSAAEYSILPHDVTGALWLEIGDPERLARAREALSEGEDSRRG
jgi:NDP-sugar pyrophosphorylase family protein